MEAELKAPLETLRMTQHYRIERFKDAFNRAPIMPRYASLSDSQRTLGKIQQHERHVKRVIWFLVSWHISTGILTRISSSEYPLRCVNLLESEWIAQTCRVCRWIFVSVWVVSGCGHRIIKLIAHHCFTTDSIDAFFACFVRAVQQKSGVLKRRFLNHTIIYNVLYI